jgi:hypothetical protein
MLWHGQEQLNLLMNPEMSHWLIRQKRMLQAQAMRRRPARERGAVAPFPEIMRRLEPFGGVTVRNLPI